MGVNNNGERIVHLCVEREFVIVNAHFRKKEINKYDGLTRLQEMNHLKVET